MKLAHTVKRHMLLVIAVLTYLLTIWFAPGQAITALRTSGKYLLEMILVIPVVFMLTMLIEVWISRKGILKNLGPGSGIKGAALSIALGSLSAGPIYAAFPICRVLLAKGLSVINLVIILSAWAVIKVPMLAMESRFLGVDFMIIRWILSIAGILLMARILSLLVKRKDIPVADEHTTRWIAVRIDESRCTGCALCVRQAPDYFVQHGKAVRVRTEGILATLAAEPHQALTELCPFGAIQ